MGRALRSSQPVRMKDAEPAVAQIVGLARSDGLRSMLDLLRSHHDPTYAHSIRVAAGLTLLAPRSATRSRPAAGSAKTALFTTSAKSPCMSRLLAKPSHLDDQEWATIRRHPVIGEETLRRGEGIPPAVIAVTANHHERLDGTGYPRGFANRFIDDLSQLANIVSVRVALTKARAYKPALDDETAFALMSRAERRIVSMPATSSATGRSCSVPRARGDASSAA